jgi:hypothetical protein
MRRSHAAPAIGALLGLTVAVTACGAGHASPGAGTSAKHRAPAASTSVTPPPTGAATVTTPSTGTPATPAPPPSTPPAATATVGPGVVADCTSAPPYRPSVRPATITLACADAGLGVEHMTWDNWTSSVATGQGRLWENLCKPSCAGGHIETMRAKVTLRGSAAVKGHPGDRQYTRLTAVFPGKRPTVYKRKHGKIVATHPKSWTFHI